MSGPAVAQTPAQQPSGSTPQGTNPQTPNPTPAGTQTPASQPGAAAKKFDAEKFATATRREKAARDLEGRAKSEWEKSQTAITEAKSYQTEKSEFKKDPLAFIKKHFGMSYEELTEIQLNDGKVPENMELKNRLSELDQWKLDQEAKNSKEKEDAEVAKAKQEEELHQQQVNDFKKSIPDKLKSIEKLDMVNLLEPEEQSEEVFKIIEAHWADEEEKNAKDPAHTPTLLSVEEAADILEEVLSEQFLTKAGRTKKFGELIRQASNPTPKKDDKKPESGFQMQTRTLTNDNGVGSSPSLLPPATENDRMQRALSALNKG